MEKKKFCTSYQTNYKKYGAHIWAKSWKEAEAIAKQRGIGEKVDGQSMKLEDGYGRKVPEEIANPDFKKLNDYEFLLQLPQIIHTACFLGWIAFNTGKLKIEQLLGDEGIIHKLAHLNNEGVDTRTIRRARGRFEQLQKLAIGHYKSL